MGGPEIIVYFDYGSAFSYIGFEYLERYRALWRDVRIEYRPVVLSEILQNAKNIVCDYKLSFLLTDLQRIAQLAKLPFVDFPANKLFDTRNALHILQYLKTNHPEKFLPALKRLWFEEYHELKALESLDDLKQALHGIVSEDVVDLAAQDQGAREQVKRNTEEVKRLRGFGAPTLRVARGDGEEQLFFGSDRFEHIAEYLGKEFYPTRTLFAGSADQ
ncbi:thioredoxin-like protein [Martensiomyces pterosporus]|nr:thioredoxin-like protein [Martensiomyces pterosporus]